MPRYQTSNFALLQELLKSVPEGDACMEWPRGRGHQGYGSIKLNYVTFVLHRVAYELAVGPIPEGMLVCHRCDNPPCFRPSHLFLGTKLDNTRDCVAKGRALKRHGEKVNTALVTEDQVREIRTLYATGQYSQQALGGLFGLKQTSVSQIVLRRNWKHVA